MKKLQMLFLATIIGALLLAGCSGGKSDQAEPGMTANEMVDEMLTQVEQPAMMELTTDQVKEIYNIDPEMLEEYAIRIPMMNVKTNEIAILKVKNEADVPQVEQALKQRAENVQKQFETYLQTNMRMRRTISLLRKATMYYLSFQTRRMSL